MNKTLQAYLDNERTVGEWSELFGIGKARVSLIRTAAAMPYVDELRAIGKGCGCRASTVAKVFEYIQGERWDAIFLVMDGGTSNFLTGRPGRAPRI